MKDEKGMNVIYMLGIYFAAKIIYSAFKKDLTNNEEVTALPVPEEDKIDPILTIEKPNEPSLHKPKELSRNSFLYTDDNFGIMKKGRE